MKRIFGMVFACLLAGPAGADDAPKRLMIGGDSFEAGRELRHDAAGTDDLFMAGETLSVTAEVDGSALLAGREISVTGKIGGDVYAAGEEVSLTGAVNGDATAFGRLVVLSDVGGDVRAAGSDVKLTGAIGGYAMVAGEDVEFGAQVAGDVHLAAEDIDWDDGASIGGTLTVYEEDPGSLDVPESVADASRIERRKIDEWEGPARPSVRGIVGKFLMGVLFVAALASLVAALVPERLAEMRRLVLDRPFRALWLGFLAQSTLIGAGILTGFTIIGLLLTPAFLIGAVVFAFAGYVIAAFAFGVGLLLTFGRSEPVVIGEKVLAAGLGALVAGIIGLIPFLGWLFVLALTLAGIGAITVRVIRPAFFSGAV